MGGSLNWKSEGTVGGGGILTYVPLKFKRAWRGFRSGTFTGDTETRLYSLKILILWT